MTNLNFINYQSNNIDNFRYITVIEGLFLVIGMDQAVELIIIMAISHCNDVGIGRNIDCQEFIRRGADLNFGDIAS